MKNKFALLASLSALFVLIFASQDVIAGSKYALNICAELILPSLFPFFVISALLAKLGLPQCIERMAGPAASRLFNVSGAGVSALFIGLCGGYPMGAAYIAQMYEGKIIERREAERLLAFCNNSGPAFIVGVIGAGVFGSGKIGLLLYAVHIMSAILVGLLFRGKAVYIPQSAAKNEPLSFSRALPEAVKQAVVSALNVCGFVVCFTVFSALLDTNGFLSLFSAKLSLLTGFELHWSRAGIIGLIELGSAAGIMRSLSPTPENLALAAAVIGWGGLSVHFQTMALISDTDIKGTLHFAGRLLSAVFSAVFVLLLA